MNDQYDPYADQRLWRPQVPSPYVTHQDIAPMHTKIGSLEKGQESILQAFAGYRAEMLTRMDRIEAAVTRPQQDQQQQGGVNLTMREMVVIAVALVLAGAILGRLMGVDRLLGG